MKANKNKKISKISTKNKFSEHKIGTILNSIGEAVITLDTKYCIKTFNPVAEELTGFLSEKVIGQPAKAILKLKNEESGKIVTWPFAEVIKKGKVVKLTNHSNLVANNKREIPISYNISPLRDVNNAIIGLIIAFRDVSKEREVQKMKSEFVSVVSHQLRTPSSAVKWYLETLIDNKLGQLFFMP